VLDVGCGGGVDTLIASIIVGPTGRAVGIDMVPEMLERAKESLRDMHFQGATFHEASAEDLPFSNESFDVVISNGAFNLVPDKEAALREVFRVLKLPGRLMMADQILIGELPDDMNAQVKSWAQ
jgi:arsenite methyltransferase